MSYVELLKEFFLYDRMRPFSKNAKVLYMHILDELNGLFWPPFHVSTNGEIAKQARLNYRAMHDASKELAARGFIYIKTRSGSKFAVYSLEPLPDDMDVTVIGNKLYKPKKTANNSSEQQEIPDKQSPAADMSANPERTTGIKRGVIRQQPVSAPPNEPYSPDGDHPPDDGVPRNWERLKERLNGLNIPPGDYRKIVQLSDYGRKEHPVWKALNELDSRKGTKDAVRNPGAWIQWHINQNPPKATAPAEAVPAPSPPVSDMPAERPPNDGAERDWDKLKSILKELKCPPMAINRIAVLSGYGKTDNPVWNAVEEIRNKGDDILQPGKWIIDYIRDNTT